MTCKTGFCTASMTRRTKIVILSYSAAQRACSVRSAAMYTFTNHVRRVIEAVHNPVFRVMYCKYSTDSNYGPLVHHAPTLSTRLSGFIHCSSYFVKSQHSIYICRPWTRCFWDKTANKKFKCMQMIIFESWRANFSKWKFLKKTVFLSGKISTLISRNLHNAFDFLQRL